MTSPPTDPVVIVGGGQAAVQLCLALRKEKVDTPVVVLSEEADYPYHRPPLSKSFLAGTVDEDKLLMRPASFYTSKQIEVVLNTRVTSIDVQAKSVNSSSGVHRYSDLVMATGARPRLLKIPGADLDGVHLLRDLDQSRKIKHELGNAQNIVVIGAGFIGLEFACVARSLGKRVTVFDMAGRVMERAVSPDVSSWFEATHRDNQIEICLKDSVTEVLGEQRVSQVKTASGDLLDCDLLLVGIGVIPNDELATEASLKSDNGVLVDEYCRSSADNIYASGDCASHPNPFAEGAMIRLESIQNATDQSRVIAKSVAGKPSPYNAVPWFWSDQGENTLQMAGLSISADQFITRGEPNPSGTEKASFSVFHFADRRLRCVDSINSPKDHMLARKLLQAQVACTPEQVADPGFDLKSLLS